MNENAPVPGPRRDLAMHNDRWPSGWEHVLPGFPLTMLIGTESQPDFTGSLDDLAHGILTVTGTGTCLVATSMAPYCSPGRMKSGTTRRCRSGCEADRWKQFSAMLTTGGSSVPTTVRDLSELYRMHA